MGVENEKIPQGKRVIEYSPLLGGVCECGQTRAHITSSGPRTNSLTRIRHHKCQRCNSIFYTVQRDRTGIAADLLAGA